MRTGPEPQAARAREAPRRAGARGRWRRKRARSSVRPRSSRRRAFPPPTQTPSRRMPCTLLSRNVSSACADIIPFRKHDVARRLHLRNSRVTPKLRRTSAALPGGPSLRDGQAILALAATQPLCKLLTRRRNRNNPHGEIVYRYPPPTF